MPLWHPVGESYNAGRPREKTGAGVRGVDLVQAWKDLPKEVTVHVRRATGAGAIPGKHGGSPRQQIQQAEVGNGLVCPELKEGKWGGEGGVWYKRKLEPCGPGGRQGGVDFILSTIGAH